ncbi:MAG: hypothetical protein COV72_03460 [Candidatus Omnitrophica bacterium CG11_big_fil_rev_8_21_14_0_20_42_13]|uniref:Polysaccharide biosynthesis protein C-terminal domain-containing protein n=1 Tax=Candidatus Ghiorseimicrobium undicola TaxID=1974746 RepID=A0A2H0LY52_9BACT|nr:MAG: hypothetical protein COV72_03460 [Candidatus Omnitrophica bacterium CG11_big_fil_rev_8_21_14_0_20_42_13]
MSKIRKFFRDTIFYLTSNFFSNIFNLITGIAVRRLLEPALMGLFSKIMLVFDYARYSHMGIIDALDKELPYCYGKKDYERFARLRDTGFSLCMIVAGLIVSGILAASFVVRFTDNMLFTVGLRIVALMIIARLLTSLYIVLNRAQNKFAVISKYTILVAALDLLFKIFLVMKFGLYGLLWASLLTLVAGLVYFFKASEEKFGFILIFSYKEALGLLKVGFPILVMGIVFMTLTNIDRITIIRLLDNESLGFYTIALMVSAYIVQLPNLIYAVIFPRFYQAYGEKQNIFEIKELFIKPMLVFAYLFPVLIGLVILMLPLLVRYLLPAYLPGLRPAYLLLLGASFLALVNMPNYLLIALNKQVHIVFIGSACILLGGVINYMMVKSYGLGLTGVAIGTAFTYFIYATFLLVHAYRNYTKKFLSHIVFLLQLYLPFLWVVALLSLIRMISSPVPGNIYKDLAGVSCKTIFFVIGCIPLVVYVNSKTSVLTLLRQHRPRMN